MTRLLGGRAGLALAALALLALALTGSAPAGAAPPPIKHVWIVVLENENYDSTWGEDSPAPYLATELRAQGKLLTQYHGTGHLSLDNYISMVSGQPPNAVTQSDCQTYTDFEGTVGPDGIAIGQGCVYPAEVPTVADQLEAAGLTWKGYMQDMGIDPVRDGGTTCGHPPIGPTSQDPTQSATAEDQYATRHNPFMYFHSIIDEPTCATNVVPLDALSADLESAATTPSFSFITPDLCNDAHDEPCDSGEPGGMEQANTFLEGLVPTILGSPAYADGGLLIITFDEAEVGDNGSDASACCNEPTGPNTPSPGINGPGGGRIGALLLSPHITPGTSDVPYNHYSLLRSVEDLFGLEHLGYAAADGLVPFGDDVYGSAAPAGGATTTTVVNDPAPPSDAGPASLPATGAPVAVGAAALLVLAALGLRRVR